MLKKIAKAGSWLMPNSIKNIIRAKISRSKKHSIIADWENSDKPIPVPHVVKQAIIEYYKSLSKYNILVETGTYLGDMVEAQRENFNQIYSIELGEKLWKDAVKRFKKYKHITILQGDSGKVLGSITQQLEESAIFWLDGHYSEGITAKGEKECPIFEEIDAIFSGKRLKHILLVDDARCFDGRGDYPTIEALTKYIRTKDERYEVEIKDDMIRYTIKQAPAIE